MQLSPKPEDPNFVEGSTRCPASKQGSGSRSRHRRTKRSHYVHHPRHEGEYSDLFGIASEDITKGPQIESLIDPEVRVEFGDNAHLIRSMHKALEKILHHFPEATVNVVVERDREDPELALPLIKVEKEIESVEEWKYVKDAVQMIARESEQDNTTIYTDVDRS